MTPLIGELLVSRNLIDKESVLRAVDASRTAGMMLGEYLIQETGFPESPFYEALAHQFSLPFHETIEHFISEELLRELPFHLFQDGRCFPVELQDQVLHIVVANPIDLHIVMTVSLWTDCVVRTSCTTPSEMERIRKKLFEGDSLFVQSAGKLSSEYEKHMAGGDTAQTIEEAKKKTESEPVVKLVSLLFDEGIKQRASDIHIEPSEFNAIVRFRIDGMLTRHMELSKTMYNPVTSRIKILADCDIAEKRVPQDGRIRYTLRGENFDFRVSTLPTHYGEKTVIRILKHDKSLLDLSNLGMPESLMNQLAELIEKPQGMIFVTGPTGSGKSSTLFACLNRIRSKAINITTIENPIEYKLEGVNQVQINDKAGVTFAATLRSILRQDPDVILVGEIRDAQTAEIAMQASQTGHLVFSTLHTNDAISALTRLRDLGIPGFLVGSSLLGILAQRLVRTLCPACRQPGEIAPETANRWSLLLPGIPLPHAYAPVGCERCGNSGFRGRTGIYELITVSDRIRTLISDNASETEIRRISREAGIKPLIFAGIEKVEKGITTPEELLRVVLVEDVASMERQQVS